MPDNPESLIVPPPKPAHFDYPVATAATLVVVLAAILVVIAGKFDRTGGALTISFIVVLTFVGALSFSLLYTVPQDPTTAAVAGALVSAFGAVIGFWLSKKSPP